MQKEIWKDIINFEGIYQVSNLGRVRSLDRIRYHPQGQMKLKGKILSQFLGAKDYLYVRVQNKKSNTSRVHRLVATAFLPNPNNKEQVNHRDGIKDNNNVENLEWCTNFENQKHSWDSKTRGVKSDLCISYKKKNIHKLTSEQVKTIRDMFSTNKFTKVALAKMFNVSDSLIRYIVQNKIHNYLILIK